MRLTRVRLQAFLSHADTTFELADRGLVLLIGQNLDSSSSSSNGSGKTAILEAIIYALFGRTLRGLTGDDVISWEAKKECLVTLEGHDGRRPFVIQRGKKCAAVPKPTLTFDPDTKSEETIVGTDEVTDAVQTLLLGSISFDTFTAALVFGETQFFTQLADADRKRVLEQLLGLQALGTFLKAAKDALTEVEASLREDEVLLAQATTAISEVEYQLKDLRPRAARFEAHRREQTEQAAAQKARLLQTAAERDGVSEAKHAEARKHGAMIASLESAYTEATEGVTTTEEARQTAMQAVSTAFAAVSQANARLQRTGKVEGGVPCPVCEQEVPARWAEDLHDQATGDLANAQREHEAARAKSAAAGEAAREALEAQRGCYEALARRKVSRDTCIREGQRAAVEAGEYRRQAEEIEVRLKSLELLKNEAAEALAEAEQRRRHQKAARSVLVKQMEGRHEEAEYLSFWLVGFGNAGMKSQLLDGVCPQLNESAARYSETFTDGTVQIRFETQRDLKSGKKKEEMALDITIDGREVSYKACSKGQKRRVDILVTMALGDLATRRVGQPINLLFLDEVFDGLDEAGVERAMRLLQEIAKERESVICISHSSELSQFFPVVDVVQYENRQSRLLTNGEAVVSAA